MFVRIQQTTQERKTRKRPFLSLFVVQCVHVSHLYGRNGRKKVSVRRYERIQQEGGL